MFPSAHAARAQTGTRPPCRARDRPAPGRASASARCDASRAAAAASTETPSHRRARRAPAWRDRAPSSSPRRCRGRCSRDRRSSPGANSCSRGKWSVVIATQPVQACCHFTVPSCGNSRLMRASTRRPVGARFGAEARAVRAGVQPAVGQHAHAGIQQPRIGQRLPLRQDRVAHIVGQRRGDEAVAAHRDDALAQIPATGRRYRRWWRSPRCPRSAPALPASIAQRPSRRVRPRTGGPLVCRVAPAFAAACASPRA